jgi:hypothetical protein
MRFLPTFLPLIDHLSLRETPGGRLFGRQSELDDGPPIVSALNFDHSVMFELILDSQFQFEDQRNHMSLPAFIYEFLGLLALVKKGDGREEFGPFARRVSFTTTHTFP